MDRSSASFEIARREFAWFKSELARPTGILMWIFVLWFAYAINRFGALGQQPILFFHWGWQALIYGGNILVGVAIVYPLMRSISLRALGPVCGDRLQDLVLARIEWKAYWPALFVAPMCTLLTMSLAVAAYEVWRIAQIDPAYKSIVAPVPVHPVLSHLYANYRYYHSLIGFFSIQGIGIGVIVSAVCLTLPRKNVQLLIVLVIVIFFVVSFIPIPLTSPIIDLIYRFHPELETSTEFLKFANAIFHQIDRFIVGTLIGLGFLFVLRSDSKRNAILRHAGIDADLSPEPEPETEAQDSTPTSADT